MASSTVIRTESVEDLQVLLYDRVSAGLWALVLIFGLLAAIVVMMWLQLQQKKKILAEATPVVALDPGEIGDLKPLGVGDDAEDPGIEEFYEVETPQLADAVEAVTDAPSRFRSLLANVDGTAPQMGKGRGLGSKTGGGGGGGGGSAERWSVEYEAENIGQYIDQLTSFGIEIGFVSKITDKVEVLFDLKTSPQIRVTTKQAERRSYFIHTNSKLRSWDLRLALNAGIKPEAKIMVQFYPAAATKRLAALEAEEATRRSLELRQIRRTLYKVRPAGSGYEYYVADIIPK